jgi:hypothetical protein
VGSDQPDGDQAGGSGGCPPYGVLIPTPGSAPVSTDDPRAGVRAR